MILALLVLVWQSTKTLILTNGKAMKCERFDVVDEQVHIRMDGQTFTLPKSVVDWSKTDAMNQAPPTQTQDALTPKQINQVALPRKTIVLTNDNFKSDNSTQASVTFPYDNIGNAVVVDVSINGQGPHRIILDTGASITVINEDLASRYGSRNGSQVALQGVGGRSHAQLVVLDEISVGGAIQRDFSAAAHTISGIQHMGVVGLLGQDFLNRYVVNLDTSTKTVTLTPHDTNPNTSPPNFEALLKEHPQMRARMEQAFTQLEQLYRSYMRGDRPSDASSTLAGITNDFNSFRSYASKLQTMLSGMDVQAFDVAMQQDVRSFTTCYTHLEQFIRSSIQMTQTMRRAFSSQTDMSSQINTAALSANEDHTKLANCI